MLKKFLVLRLMLSLHLVNVKPLHAGTSRDIYSMPAHPKCMDTTTSNIDNNALDRKAESLLILLKELDLNIITVESASCGMIASTLGGALFYGRYIYGGFVTYDSDAKRFLGVEVEDVYTAKAAKAMATGALNNSRAMIALSITGYAAPARGDKLGHFDIGFAIRTKPYYTLYHDHLNACGLGGDITLLCNEYVKEIGENEKGFAPSTLTKTVRQELRKMATWYAMDFAAEILSDMKITANYTLDSLDRKSYDGLYQKFGEPSEVILNYLEQ